MLLPLDKISTTIAINTQLKQETKTNKSILSRATCTCKIISFLHQQILISFALNLTISKSALCIKCPSLFVQNYIITTVYSLVTG